MAKICKVFYAEIDPKVCTMQEAGEYYYHFNLLGSHEMFHESYEQHEKKQVDLI